MRRTSARLLRTVAGFEAAVGRTPLLRLRGPSEATGCEIFGKCEFMNPGGSVKDRAALNIITHAEKHGLLRPGGTIVEGTAGNTGIGLTAVANARGYRTVIVIPETQTQEKKDALLQMGARLVEVKARPYRHPDNYVKLSGRLAEQLGGLWANQFDNVANREAHAATTGPEIWKQTAGKVDAFSCAVGTGGTLAGTAAYLREVSGGRVRVGLTDPPGGRGPGFKPASLAIRGQPSSLAIRLWDGCRLRLAERRGLPRLPLCSAALVRWYRDGELRSIGDSITEGIGQGRVTGNLEGFAPDPHLIFEVDDSEALRTAYELLRAEGLALGLSSGTNVAGAIAVARRLGPGHTVVTILCDLATRYASKMFNADFLRARGLPEPTWLLEGAQGSPRGAGDEVDEALAAVTCGD